MSFLKSVMAEQPFIGGYRTSDGYSWWYNRSKYMPNQGKQESARRLARMQG